MKCTNGFKKRLVAKKYYILFSLIVFLIGNLFSQTPTYYQDVYPIVMHKCNPCHNEKFNEIIFDDFESFSGRSQMITYVLKNKIMPPWPPDDSYAVYKNNRSLTTEEYKIIESWIKTGKREGNKPVEIEINKQQIFSGERVAQLQIPLINVPINSRDTFINFTIPFELDKSYSIRGIEFMSKQLKYLHHCNLFISDTLTTYSNPKNIFFTYGYVPGLSQREFPEGMGFILPKKGYLFGDFHFSPMSESVNFILSLNFYESNARLEHTLRFIGRTDASLSDGSEFMIPKDSIKSFTGIIDVTSDVKIINVNPHMHLLGKSFEAYCLTPKGERINLIKIPEWYFNWQDFYEFEKPVFIPKGSKIYVHAKYDNTKENLNNPNYPPIDVKEGWRTSEEMMSLIMLGWEELNTQ